MGRRPLSSYPPEVAAKMRADMQTKMRQAWVQREANRLGTRQNGTLLTETQAKIAESVRQRWQDGAYAARVNGMTGRTGAQAAQWTWGRRDYAVILEQHEPRACAHCGATDAINAHHVDENHGNYLLSNLMWLCVPCHAWRYHYRRSRTPFMVLGKSATLEYAHILPWHPGKCSRLHGHSGRVEVQIRGRLDPNGIIADFFDIGAALKAAVIERLDHQFLNDIVDNPTVESLLLWTWDALESIGLKGLRAITWSETDSTSATVTVADMTEAFGWDHQEDRWLLVAKPTPDYEAADAD